MNLSPLQLDMTAFHTASHYQPSYYPNTHASTWLPSSSSLLCTTTNYQPIENYCPIEPFYPPVSEPVATSSDRPFYPSSVPLPPPPPPASSSSSSSSSHLCPTDDFLLASSPSALMLPQNRANYTRHQLIMLNEIFKKHKYPNSVQKTLIAKYIGVSRDQIRIWFQNKRRKVQLISKGQAKQTKTDVECEYGEYRRHLPNNFLDELFQDLYKARAAPARLPVKRDTNPKVNQFEQEQAPAHLLYYPAMNSAYYYPSDAMIEHDGSSPEQSNEQYMPNYPHAY